VPPRPQATSTGGTVGAIHVKLHLFVYPLTRGSGPRLFREGAGPAYRPQS